MTSPFLHIVNSPSGLSQNSSDVGSQAVNRSSEEQIPGTVPFADILGGTQQVPLQESSSANHSSEEETVVSQTFTQEELLISLNAQVISEIPVGVSDPTVTGALIQNGLTQNSLPHGQEPLVGGNVGSVLNGLNGIVQTPTLAGTNVEKPITQASVGHTVSPLDTLPFVVKNNQSAGGEVPLAARLVHFGEADVERRTRIQPLLNESSSAILNSRPPLASVPVAGSDSLVSAQQSLAKLEVVGNNSQTNLGSLYVQSRLPQAVEEPSSPIMRIEGDGKMSGITGVSPSGETGLGSAGGGLPFGQHLGNGQGQLFDSSLSSQLSTTHGQMAAKAGNFDERLQLLNASVPQRLQIDVQLTESARVQVDVGVQQRQVFAGVLLDNPVLRSLAAQNIQVLEEQLGKADMELEEFDVHGDDQLLNESPGQEHDGRKGFQGEPTGTLGSSFVHQSQEKLQNRIEVDTGWHLVA